MEYAEYKADSKNFVLKNRSAYRVFGHTAATLSQYCVYVAEGVAKNTYNALRGITASMRDYEVVDVLRAMET